MIENKDFISSISFTIKNENNQRVSFNGQSVTFRLSVKEIEILPNKCPKQNQKSKTHLNKNRQKPNLVLESNQSQFPPNSQGFKKKLLSGIGF